MGDQMPDATDDALVDVTERALPPAFERRLITIEPGAYRAFAASGLPGLYATFLRRLGPNQAVPRFVVAFYAARAGRPDEAIAREIREDVILKTLWIAPDALEIAVEAGAVTLRGHVESKIDAELIVPAHEVSEEQRATLWLYAWHCSERADGDATAGRRPPILTAA